MLKGIVWILDIISKLASVLFVIGDRLTRFIQFKLQRSLVLARLASASQWELLACQ